MSIVLLRTLVAIADAGSFGGAAARVNVSPAAVGQQMKRLETVLRTTLFDRGGAHPRLNTTARALVPRARELVLGYDALVEDVAGARTGDGLGRVFGELTLGAVPSTLLGLVPLTVKSPLGVWPELRVRVVPGLTPDLLEQVERGSLDSAILTRPAALAPELVCHGFVDEPLVLLTAPGVTGELDGADALRLLATRPYIRHTRRNAAGMLAEDWLRARRIRVRSAMEMESLEAIASMVSHDLGVSITPDLCVPDPIFAALGKVRLPGPPRARRLCLVARADGPKLRLVDELLGQLREVVARFGGPGQDAR